MMLDEKVKLPTPASQGKLSVEEAIWKRRSVRSFRKEALTVEQISQLLWATQGLTTCPPRDGGRGYRAAPSAGATFPLEIHLLNSDGIYHYHPQDHSLTQTVVEDRHAQLAQACWGQYFVEEAPINVIISAVFRRTTAYYGRRGERYVLIEVGHAAQNLHLQAVALGLSSVPIGAFDDQQVAEVLSLPKEMQPLYVVSVGYPKEYSHGDGYGYVFQKGCLCGNDKVGSG